MRAAKSRKRELNPSDREPKMERYYPLQIGVMDERTGDQAWVPFKSVRDAVRRLAVVQRFYLP